MERAKIVSAAFIVLCHHMKKKRKKRCHWVTPVESRALYGGINLFSELLAGNSGQFEKFYRMSFEDFEHLLNLIEPEIMKKDTNYRVAISSKERLAITLHFLATGDSFTSLMHLFKISKQSVSTIVIEVCMALNEALKPFVKLPSTPEGWKRCSEDFDKTWNFPHCLAAVDGKHIMLQAPINFGSEYYNYKNFFSIVLFALVDSNYNFLFADVSSPGRISDGGIFKNSVLWKKVQDNSLNIPRPEPLPGREQMTPYVILADEAFALHKNVMKPYAGHTQKGSKKRIFNYRLSRARRVVENCFGILTSVFRVLRKPMLLGPEKASVIVLTTVYLHNYLRQSKTSSNLYAPVGAMDSELRDGTLVEGTWRREVQLTSLRNLKAVPRKSSSNARGVREEIADYFVSNGRIPWQDDAA